MIIATITTCQNNHIQICYQIEKPAPMGEKKNLKAECPVCREIDIAKGFNKTLILAIDRENKMNKEITKLNAVVIDLKGRLDEIKHNLKNILTTYLIS